MLEQAMMFMVYGVGSLFFVMAIGLLLLLLDEIIARFR